MKELALHIHMKQGVAPTNAARTVAHITGCIEKLLSISRVALTKCIYMQYKGIIIFKVLVYETPCIIEEFYLVKRNKDTHTRKAFAEIVNFFDTLMALIRICSRQCLISKKVWWKEKGNWACLTTQHCISLINLHIAAKKFSLWRYANFILNFKKFRGFQTVKKNHRDFEFPS